MFSLKKKYRSIVDQNTHYWIYTSQPCMVAKEPLHGAASQLFPDGGPGGGAEASGAGGPGVPAGGQVSVLYLESLLVSRSVYSVLCKVYSTWSPCWWPGLCTVYSVQCKVYSTWSPCWCPGRSASWSRAWPGTSPSSSTMPSQQVLCRSVYCVDCRVN